MVVAFTFTKSRSNLILIVKNVKREINFFGRKFKISEYVNDFEV